MATGESTGTGEETTTGPGAPASSGPATGSGTSSGAPHVLPEPEWALVGQNTWKPISGLDSIGLRPSIITGIFTRLVEMHYSAAVNIRDPVLKDYIWKEKGAQTLDSRILIQPYHMFRPEAAEQRPAVYVRRGQVFNTRLAIGDKAGTHLSQPGGVYLGELYARLVNGIHEIHCMAVGDMAADRLAEETYWRFMEYIPAIRDEFHFSDLQADSLLPCLKVPGGKDSYDAAFSVKWSFGCAWRLKPIAPVLKGVRAQPL